MNLFVLQCIALNFILTGRDMSSVALSWFFWLVMYYLKIEDKIVKEISTVLNNTHGTNQRKWVQKLLV